MKHKASQVIWRHRDKIRNILVHTPSTLQMQSLGLLMVLIEIFGLEERTGDMTQAYLQSPKPHARDIYIREPLPEFKLEQDQCIQLLRPLYSLCHAEDL